METNKVVPSIWFTADAGKISNLLNYYKSVFGDAFRNGQVIPLGETPSGNSEMSEIHLFGQKFIFMSTAKEHHALNDSVSLMISCEDQAEIDRYWNYFTKEGKASQCGWCIDKYGLRWQVIPKNLGQLMSKPNAFAVMMKQTKIVIAEYN